MNTPMEIVLGDWVLAQAFAQATRWNEQGNPIQISINISASQLQEDRFYDKLTQLLQTYPLVSPHQIELEVLESSALQDIDKAVMVLERCRALGMGAALDDFGTGYSSLTFFRRLPVNLVKIDRSFVSELPSDLEDQVIIEGVVSMAGCTSARSLPKGWKASNTAKPCCNSAATGGKGMRLVTRCLANNWLSGRRNGAGQNSGRRNITTTTNTARSPHHRYRSDT
ncbi:EAL domain-containing protein [Paludibacterium denitrificans]|uniref:EAL domain-containing protein n=1 Tax=Paludibacterium denitrificans TaxID=2675226 RepID=A0A844GFX6_9NEIS|nr:EAL domain-containing protein [Paludibacterium denitrificans]MTD33807.1 EAL domain-containing protein [Paludibacterium denitrificans]